MTAGSRSACDGAAAIGGLRVHAGEEHAQGDDGEEDEGGDATLGEHARTVPRRITTATGSP